MISICEGKVRFWALRVKLPSNGTVRAGCAGPAFWGRLLGFDHRYIDMLISGMPRSTVCGSPHRRRLGRQRLPLFQDPMTHRRIKASIGVPPPYSFAPFLAVFRKPAFWLCCRPCRITPVVGIGDSALGTFFGVLPETGILVGVSVAIPT